MNKSDWKLVISLALVIIISFALLFLFKNSNTPKKALVYYEAELVLEIDLSLKGEHEYHVSGYNGDILIKTNDNKIKLVLNYYINNKLFTKDFVFYLK